LSQLWTNHEVFLRIWVFETRSLKELWKVVDDCEGCCHRDEPTFDACDIPKRKDDGKKSFQSHWHNWKNWANPRLKRNTLYGCGVIGMRHHCRCLKVYSRCIFPDIMIIGWFFRLLFKLQLSIYRNSKFFIVIFHQIFF